jgi:16S rRNA (guanine527-N7)-methyltransferase
MGDAPAAISRQNVGMTNDHPTLATLEAEAARLGVTLDAEALERFGRYLALIIAWSRRAGLTSVSDPDEIQRRHLAESLALQVLLRDAGIATGAATDDSTGDSGTMIVDIGAGAGFPGVPMLIADPSLRLTLVESNGRRCDFLREVVRDLSLDGVSVVNARAEDAGRDPELRAQFDLVVARAVAPMPVLVEYALPLLRKGGLLATPKGSRAIDDLAQAEAAIAALGGVAEPSLPLSLPANVPPQTVLLVRRTGKLKERYPRRAGIPAKRPIE